MKIFFLLISFFLILKFIFIFCLKNSSLEVIKGICRFSMLINQFFNNKIVIFDFKNFLILYEIKNYNRKRKLLMINLNK